MRLIEEYDRSRQAMQLPQPRRFASRQGLKELDAGRHHDRCAPEYGEVAGIKRLEVGPMVVFGNDLIRAMRFIGERQRLA